MTTTTNDDIAAMAARYNLLRPPQRGGSQIAVPRPSAEAALIIMDRSAERPSRVAYYIEDCGCQRCAASVCCENKCRSALRQGVPGGVGIDDQADTGVADAWVASVALALVRGFPPVVPQLPLRPRAPCIPVPGVTSLAATWRAISVRGDYLMCPAAF